MHLSALTNSPLGRGLGFRFRVQGSLGVLRPLSRDRTRTPLPLRSKASTKALPWQTVNIYLFAKLSCLRPFFWQLLERIEADTQ